MRITAIGGDITYEGGSVFEIRNSETKQMEARRIKRVGMISAGSGIAPMYQLTQTVADSSRDLTSLSLIYSNRTPVSALFPYKNVCLLWQYDMILDEDLTEFEKIGKLCYLPLVQNPDENWTQAKGRITKPLIENFMPFDYSDSEKDSVVMVCGPGKLKEAVQELGSELGMKNLFFFN